MSSAMIEEKMSESEETAKDDSLFEFDQEEGYDTSTRVSMETQLPESNMGYKLLQKMGWKAGEGLGSSGQGRIDPIRIELKDDSLGLGKSTQLNTAHIITTSKRKALDSEKQLEETDIQRQEREYQTLKKQAIAKELEQVKRAFYCELCDKQYKKISEYEQHLQSYDHHHKQRFKDMKESTRNSSSDREKRLAREKKREEKELKRMQDAIQKKTGVVHVPVEPVTIKTTATGGGGWTSTSDRGGWSSNPIQSNTQFVSTVATPMVSANPNSIISSNTMIESNTLQPPKKLSFGLKKNNGFQFGLKKK